MLGVLLEMATVYVEGYLYKTGGGGQAWSNRAWKRRWVKLEFDRSIRYHAWLFYFRDRGAAKPRGAVLLSEATLDLPSATDDELCDGLAAIGVQTRHCFYLKGQHRTYMFAAESHHDLQRWLRPLSAVMRTEPALCELIASFTTSAGEQPVTIRVASFNMGRGVPTSSDDIRRWLRPDTRPSLYAVTVQECKYEPVLGASDCEGDWLRLLSLSLGPEYERLSSISMRDIRLAVYVLRELVHEVSQIETAHKATGLGGIVGNKGAVASSLHLRNSSLCFVGAHLAARPERLAERNANFADILEGLRLGRKEFELTQQFHHVFWAGDLNYRVELPFEEAISAAEIVQLPGGGAKIVGLAELLESDQLRRERGAGNAFQGFVEPPLTFAPTYKCEVGVFPRVYADKRGQAPSFTDRVLYHSLARCEHELAVLSYEAEPTVTLSDHTPVSATFELRLRAHQRLPSTPKVEPLLKPRSPLSTRQAAAAAASTHAPCHLCITELTVELLNVPPPSAEGALCCSRARWEGVAAIQLTYSGSFLEAAGESIVVHETGTEIADEIAHEMVKTDAAVTEAVTEATLAKPRRIVEFVLHPLVHDLAHLREQHLLILVRQGKTLVGGGALPLADLCSPRLASFECTVTLRGKPTAVLRGRGQAFEERPGAAMSRWPMASVPPALAPVLPAAVLERMREGAADVDAVDKGVKVDSNCTEDDVDARAAMCCVGDLRGGVGPHAI